MHKTVALYTLFFSVILYAKPTVTYKTTGEKKAELTVLFKLSKNDCLYHDYFSVSVDSPDIIIDNWQTDTKPVEQFDTDFKEPKKMYLDDTLLTAQLTYLKPTFAHVHINYYQKNNKKIDSLSIPISPKKRILDHDDDTLTVTGDDQKLSIALEQGASDSIEPALSWSDTISHVIEATDSLWIRILFALILGLLLSLTPCIYPMIPITVGILQAQGATSIFKNFLLAVTYSIGIATTFALLGLTAAFTGQIFGSLLAKPLFVFGLVLFLLYLAGSMIGFYDMYIPSFLQPRTQRYKGGSIVSVFLFGAVSGTIASPCLSPGLFLLLTIVSSIGSKLIGFLLLFAFGMGLGIPLLIIGTFSGSLNVLPSAGMWMVEVKKFFGFIMIGMCFFYLKNIVAWEILLWIVAATLLLSGIFYLYQAHKVYGWKKFYNALGMLLIVAAVATTFKAIQSLNPMEKSSNNKIAWMTDYNAALATARKKNKKIFVDITAPFCSICKVIDKKMFHNETVITHLNNFIRVKINNKDENEQHAKLQEKWSIKGVPSFLIIDPETEAISAQFGAEINNWSPEEFVKKVGT